jgi:hypothetical protein
MTTCSGKLECALVALLALDVLEIEHDARTRLDTGFRA